jgi:hypothetical protein
MLSKKPGYPEHFLKNPHPGSLSLADPPRKGEGEESASVTICDSPAIKGTDETVCREFGDQLRFYAGTSGPGFFR